MQTKKLVIIKGKGTWRRPRVYIETISIFCPACEEDVENPEPGMGHVFNQDEFDRLPQVFKCQCGATIKKPRNPW